VETTTSSASAASTDQRDSTPGRGEQDERVPAFYKRRRRRHNELGQVLLRRGAVTPEHLRQALRIQAEQGGHLGAILKKMGACDGRAIADALLEQVRVARTGVSLAERARANPSIVGLRVPCRPTLTRAVLVASDALSLSAAAVIMWLVIAGDALTMAQRLGVSAIVPMCIAVFAATRLYALTPPSPPEEIRRVFLSLSLVYLGSWCIAVLARSSSVGALSHGAWLAGWLVSVLLVPIVRGAVRARFSKGKWWGQPVVVLGAGKVGRAVVSTLQQRPQLGLKPVAILDDDTSKHGTLRATWGEDDITVESVEHEADSSKDRMGTPSTRQAWAQFSEVEGVPVVGGFDLAPVLAQRLHIRSAVVALPEMDTASLLGLIERFGEGFSSVVVIPDLFNLAHFGAPTQDLGGVLGIEVRRQLLLKWPRLIKRAMDIVLTSLGGVLLLPFLAVLALLIKLDSKGSPFYRQKRLGQDGVRFMALKFRSMYGDGEERLTAVLNGDARLRAEYEQFHKLADDPRVTRIGRVLRKYSLDELPQLWNVLVGDMSLVGPRPYLEREIPEMDQQEAIILRVKPGITGIWQVSGRNLSTFQERVQLDVEYVRNWSPWLDIYVLARTVPVVVGGTGS
jgi:exopolysaccharide biosynthesis polyprenyl glycosylphosphotransferase